MFHGLAAYCGGNKGTQIISKANNVVGNEVCCSDKAIGPVGVFVSGHVTDAYFRDCWSWVNPETGRRETSQESSGVNLEHSEGWLAALRLCIAEEGDSYRYAEIFCISESIDCIWIKVDAKERFKKIARVLGRKYNVPVVTVTNDSNALNWR
ncbi:MAG: hypothetical protein ACOYM1_11635 [Methylovulum sp.]